MEDFENPEPDFGSAKLMRGRFENVEMLAGPARVQACNGSVVSRLDMSMDSQFTSWNKGTPT